MYLKIFSKKDASLRKIYNKPITLGCHLIRINFLSGIFMQEAHAYTAAVAQHYAAYRPPLHCLLLETALGQQQYEAGLDIGCGTGHSSRELTQFCQLVTGIDLHEEMLHNAPAYPNVRYAIFNGQQIPFPDQTFEIITFAGSLYYAKSVGMRNETLRVGKPEGLVLTYDFAVLLEPFLKALGITLPETATGYNHRENFDDMPHHHLQKVEEKQWDTAVATQWVNIAHLLLAEHAVFPVLKHIEVTQLADALEKSFGTDKGHYSAKLYYSLYQIIH
jgi:ubiquinone/menaquinone biosynthesis C-methylase UbiE